MSDGALASYVVNKIGDLCIQETCRLGKLKGDVESLKQELQMLEIFLHSKDYKQRQDEATKNWLSSVRDVVYEAEDLIDTYFLGQRYAPATKAFNSYSVQKKIKSLKSKIREIGEVPNLHEQDGNQSRLHPWRRSSPHLGDDVVVGFDHDVSLIVDKLLHQERRRQVVAITGMGGAGKTTLAAVVYNSISKVPVSGRTFFTRLKEIVSRAGLQNHFDVCAWVPVHQDPDIMVLLWTISRQLGFGESAFKMIDLNHFEESFNVLKMKIYEFLERRRYLIVLDDIWRKDVWDQLKPALPDSGNGSRIIVTTRFRDVAVYHDPDFEPYEMRPLNEDDSWRLFLTKVFPLQLTPPHDQPIRPRELEDLGRQLCRKCAGLPLALVVLGGLVSTEMRDTLVWSNSHDNMNWDSTDDWRRCLEILALSYYDLPCNIKLCFLYLGAFPQGSQISASKLTKLWIGDDLIPKEEGATLEDTATNYLEELAQRCLVEIVKRGPDTSIKKVRVHDLLGELAKSEAGESRFLQVKNLTTIEEMSKPQEIGAHRMAIHQSHDILKEISDEKLRALLVFPPSSDRNRNRWFQRLLPVYHESVLNIGQIDIRMELLRLLELGGFARNGNLELHFTKTTRLRYLGLRNTNVRRLLFSKGIPTHLQTLDIRGTTITKLPSKVWTLSELRHLYLNSMSLLDSQALRNIEKTLSKAASAKSIRMSCMPLHNLQTLKIEDDCEAPDTTHNKLVWYLELLSSLNSLTIRAKEIPQEIFTATSTHAKLHKLKLYGTLQPDELCSIECFAPHITELTFSRSNLKGEPTRTLGMLKNLRILKLTDDAFLCPEISCSPGSFPNLSYLKLRNLSHLELLNMERGSLPNLIRLSLNRCTNLRAVPNVLSRITTLQVLKCKNMPSSFTEEMSNWVWTHAVRVIIQNPLPERNRLLLVICLPPFVPFLFFRKIQLKTTCRLKTIYLSYARSYFLSVILGCVWFRYKLELFISEIGISSEISKNKINFTFG